MNVWETVYSRDGEVRRGLRLFAAGVVVFVLTVDLVYFVWLLRTPFDSVDNLEIIGWMVGILLATTLFSLWRMARDGRAIVADLGAVPLADYMTRKSPRESRGATQLDNIMDELCIAAACPKPSLYVLPRSGEINAFACGLNPEGWCITVTDQALRRLNRDQMQALVAHELAHLTRGDTRSSVLTCAYVAGLSLTMVLALFIACCARGRNGAPIAILALMAALAGALGVLLGQLLEASLSRSQEFRADAEAVRLTRHADGMVSLLRRIAEGFVKNKSSSWDDLEVLGYSRSSLLFSHGLRTRWFDSHPPLVERIRVFDPAAAEEVRTLLMGRR